MLEKLLEQVTWTYGSVRGTEYRYVKEVRGTLWRCLGCGKFYERPTDAREHVVYECRRPLLR